MILPSRRQLWAWAVLAVAQGLLLWAGGPPVYGWALAGLWLAVLAAGAFALWREKSALTVSRECSPVQQSGRDFSMRLFVRSAMTRRLTLHVFDHYPAAADCHSLPLRADVSPGESLEIAYPLVFNQRGRFRFECVQLRYADRSGLWLYERRADCPCDVRVYPRFDHDPSHSAFAGIRTPQPGHVRPLHSRSGNGDFSHLRNYLEGDALSRIDHKASARHGKWLVRDYEFEHQQPVILMLDGSRRQQIRHQGKTLFDELLNAATQLARAALKAGDEVGLQVFSDDVRTWLAPSRQSGQYRRVVETLFDRHADSHPPDYAAALHDVYRRQRQRALIVLITTLESGDERILRPVLHLVQQRHHLMLVNLRPPWLYGREAAREGENALDIAQGEAARIVYDSAFAALQERLKREKLIFIPAQADTLRPQLLNAYLAYKDHLRR